jgi:2-phospho-L-lactate guanylyltransferase
LAPVLTPKQRAELSRKLLQQTIRQAKPTAEEVLIISRSHNVRQVAEQAGAQTMAETDHHLNAAVQAGIKCAQAAGAEMVLILPADLPLLTTAALQTFINLADGLQSAAAIAPCRRQDGTNALLLRPPQLIIPNFGVGSFINHQTAVRQAGLTPMIHHAPELAFDLDTPADWLDLLYHQTSLTHLTA